MYWLMLILILMRKVNGLDCVSSARRYGTEWARLTTARHETTGSRWVECGEGH